MAQINEVEALKEAIALLKIEQVQQLTAIKTQLNLVCQKLSPSHFIKNTLHQAATLPNIKNDFIDTLIGLTTGYLSKKILIGTSNNPIKKIIGLFLEFTVASFTAKHSQAIKAIGGVVIERLFKK